jgi:hypothetical protein
MLDEPTAFTKSLSINKLLSKFSIIAEYSLIALGIATAAAKDDSHW